jgi:hypothetical protein
MADKKITKVSDYQSNYLLIYKIKQQNWFLIMKLFALTCDIFSVIKKILEKPFFEIFLREQNIFLPYLLKIRQDFKKMIYFSNKTNYILKITNQFLNYFQYSILNSEVKIGKLKGFIYSFIRSNYNKVKSKNYEETNSLGSKKTYQTPFNFLLSNKFNLDYFKKKEVQVKISKENFFGKLIKKVFSFFPKINKGNFFTVKIEINYYFEKKLNEISIIRRKIFQYIKLNQIFTFKLKKKSAFYKIKPISYSIERKLHETIQNNSILIVENPIFNYFLPVGINNNNLFFRMNFSKKSILLFLFKSQSFKFYLKQNSFKINGFFYPNSNTEIYDPKKKRRFLIKKEFLFYEFKSKINPKTRIRKTSKNFFLYRLLDLKIESHILWQKGFKDNLRCKKTKKMVKKKTFYKQIFLGKFDPFVNRIKILFYSLQKKFLLLSLKIKYEIKIRKSFCLKFQELKSMEIDFQSFSDFFKQLINNK